jgi:hypothetical protein
MAIIANTATTYSGAPGLAGLREDLSNIIYNISPNDTPFMSGIGRGKATQTLHEWQTDDLADADTTNAQLQGDDISTYAAASTTTRLGNRTQISRKTVIIDGTVEAVDKAGRKSELAYQMAKRSKELKRDIESILLTNQARVTGNTTTAPKLASVLSWIHTNTNHVGTDPTGDGSDTRVDGTQRALDEGMVNDVLSQIWEVSSEEPDVLMVGGWNKTVVSGFDGNNVRNVNATGKKLVASIDVYESDFGTVRIVPNRFMRPRDALVINFDYWALAWLRPIKSVELAKTGDAEKRMLIGEYTLEAKNEAASGGIFDLTTS